MHALGSGKYPGEAYFKNFAGENGGKTNAFTASEGFFCENKKATCYQLAIMGQQNYEKLLDIFSNLFIDAQFEESGTERQLAAVDSEYDLRKESFAVELVLKEALMTEDHPMQHFGAGNRFSIWEYPREEFGLDPLEVLHQWYRRNYCSPWMKLVLQANLSLPTLQDYAERYFGQIPTRDQTKPDLHKDRHGPHHSLSLEKIIKIIPYGNGPDAMQMYFPLPSYLNNIACDPVRFLEYVLTYEGPGSLSSYLQQHNLGNIQAYQWVHIKLYSIDEDLF
ncbi:unnamed protein product [Oikopleura dioica]|uniref:Peptidase M16 C-terminal domain-containing protein n=1 Tax=Oikopleura dioica TaxID=34765 RepID=E4WW46_OIKDI|nr:unnamed protein product [Oikopleura dioica]